MLNKIQSFTENYENFRKARWLTNDQGKKVCRQAVIFATTYTYSATCLPLWPSTFAVLNQTTDYENDLHYRRVCRFGKGHHKIVSIERLAGDSHYAQPQKETELTMLKNVTVLKL